MALPVISNVEKKITDKIKSTVESIPSRISDSFGNLADGLKHGISAGVKSSTGFDIEDFKKSFNLDRFTNTLSEEFSALTTATEVHSSRLEELIEEMKDETTEELEGVNDKLSGLEKFLKWEKEKGMHWNTKPVIPPEPEVPEEDPKIKISALLMGALGKLIKGAFRAIPAALVAGALVVSIKDGIKSWDIGEAIGERLGLNSNVGGIVNTLIGNAQESLIDKISRYGKYAAAGAALGAVGFLPGIILGGILGAATGMLVDAVASWIGKDKIFSFVDSVADSVFEGIEFFTGTDKNRLAERIEKLKKAKGDVGDAIAKQIEAIADVDKKIADARASGKDYELQRLERVRDQAVQRLEDMKKQTTDLDSRISEFQKQSDNASQGFIKDAEDFADKALDYVVSIPLRYIDSFVDWFSGKSIWGRWTMSTDEAYENSPVLKAFENAEKIVSTHINDTATRLADFFIKDIPDSFNRLVEIIQNSISDAFNSVVEVAKIAADEISVKDFVPSFLGGSEKGLSERISERLNSRVEDNTEKRSSVVNQVNDSVDQLSTTNNDNSNNTVNSSVFNSTNVVNKNMQRAPNSTSNTDSTSRLLELSGSGAVILP